MAKRQQLKRTGTKSSKAQRQKQPEQPQKASAEAMTALAARAVKKLRQRLGGEKKLREFLNQPDARSERDAFITTLEVTDAVFRKERQRLRKSLEKAYKLKTLSVRNFFRQFPVLGQLNFQQVNEVIEAAPREIQKALKEHLRFTTRWGVRFALQKGQFSLRPLLTFGRKFHLKQVNGHLKAARPVPQGEPAMDYWEEPDLKVWPPTQELISEKKVKFVQINDARGYSILNELERLAYQSNGVTVIQHTAERPYLYFLFGEAVRKGMLDTLGKTLTAFQNEHYKGQTKAGRPADIKRQKKIDEKVRTAKPGTRMKEIAGLPEVQQGTSLSSSQSYVSLHNKKSS